MAGTLDCAADGAVTLGQLRPLELILLSGTFSFSGCQFSPKAKIGNQKSVSSTWPQAKKG